MFNYIIMIINIFSLISSVVVCGRWLQGEGC